MDYGEIADLAVSGFSIQEVLIELELPSELEDDAQVQEAFESGLIHIFLQEKINGTLDEHIIDSHHITQSQCSEWAIKHDETIRLQRLQISQDTRDKVKQHSSTLLAGINGIVSQDNTLIGYASKEALVEDIGDMVERLKSGNTDDLLAILATQAVQLQMLNTKVTKTISNTNSYEIMSKFQNIQLKTMNETRKTVTAINEIVNPKKTTFIKEASQNNFLHQETSKKIENENELFQLNQKESTDAYQYTEAETVTVGEN